MERACHRDHRRDTPASTLDAFDAGFLVGILVGEGHFGGDGRQPQVTLRMHTDHAALFEWLMERFPESRLYGPYDHAGRRYYQWMARGRSCASSCCRILPSACDPNTAAASGTATWRCATRTGCSGRRTDRTVPRAAGPAAGGAAHSSE